MNTELYHIVVKFLLAAKSIGINMYLFDVLPIVKREMKLDPTYQDRVVSRNKATATTQIKPLNPHGFRG